MKFKQKKKCEEEKKKESTQMCHLILTSLISFRFGVSFVCFFFPSACD